MLAKCGKVRSWHWAHVNGEHCDNWWEKETDWHRDWKNRFPVDWQEKPLKSGEELHFADVKTPDGMVIEFQHSHISEDEVAVRENFYGSMVWVINGARLSTDRSNFLSGMDANRKPDGQYVFNGNGRRITKRWSASQKLIFLDFGADDLWCVTPWRNNWQFFATRISKADFVQASCISFIALALATFPKS